jgi:RNA polymerase sigma-70 factor (ECF subfamily)
VNLNAAAEPVDVAGAVSVEHIASFQAARPRLFAVAYGVLGNPAEADDVVQDAWTRWQGTDRDRVRDAAAFLAATTRRLAVNVSDSAHARRETSVGPWLPERVDSGADPARDAEQREALERAVLILIERLYPAERAAYVLREAFDYPYRQISHLLGLTEANARQLVARARGHLFSQRRNPVNAGEKRRFVDAFVAAAETGELAMLEELLAMDVARHSDHGRRRRAAPIPLIRRAGASTLPASSTGSRRQRPGGSPGC